MIDTDRRRGRQPEETAYQQIRDVLRRGRTFLLTTHCDPDGDGLGAELALGEALAQLGKSAHIVNSDRVPPQYHFLAGNKIIQRYSARAHQSLFSTCDVAVLLDAIRPERTGRLAPALESFPGIKVAIDHHGPGGWASLELSDETAVSTTQVVYDLLCELPVKMGPNVAGYLFTGLVTDTNGFRTPNVSPRVLRLAAGLIGAGASHEEVCRAIFASWSMGCVRVLGTFLARLNTAARGRVVWGVVRREDLRKYRCRPVQIDRFAEEALRVGTATIAMVFVEEPLQTVRVSFRSRPGVRVDHLARSFGGDGHPQSAGTRMKGDIESVVVRVVRKARIAA